MANDTPFSEMLGEGGAVRAALKSTLSWGDWADVFCDELLKRLRETHIEDLVNVYGAYFVSYGVTASGVTVNVRWKEDRGFECYRGDTIPDALQTMWLTMAAGKKGQDHGE